MSFSEISSMSREEVLKCCCTELFQAVISPQFSPDDFQYEGAVDGILAKKSEVKFIFKRYRHWWRVIGYIPLAVAREIYESNYGSDIRVDGLGWCAKPESGVSISWEELRQKGLYFKNMTWEQALQISIQNGIPCGVGRYDVDTQDALNFLVNILQNYELGDCVY